MLAFEFNVFFIEEECDVRCECRRFEFRGILCSHILSALPLMEINKVPSKYILKRWRKDFKRKHTFVKCSYDDQLVTPIARRFENLCKHFDEVAENGSRSDALYNLVMNGLDEFQIKIDAHDGSKEILEHQKPSTDNDMMLKQGKVVHSPIAVRRRGRPPSLRKQSKLDQVVKRMRMKKQQKLTSTNGVQRQRGRKLKPASNTKDGESTNIQCSQKEEGTFSHTNSGGYEAECAGSVGNHSQELQSNQLALTSHMSSYIDLLQGNGDLIDLLSQNMNR